MAVMLLAQYEVSDAERFVAAFDGYEATRRGAGAIGSGLMRAADDPATMVAMITFGSRAEAQAFASSPDRAATLAGAGVTRTTDRLLETVRPFAP